MNEPHQEKLCQSVTCRIINFQTARVECDAE